MRLPALMSVTYSLHDLVGLVLGDVMLDEAPHDCRSTQPRLGCMNRPVELLQLDGSEAEGNGYTAGHVI